jgi:hypothetical protein
MKDLELKEIAACLTKEGGVWLWRTERHGLAVKQARDRAQRQVSSTSGNAQGRLPSSDEGHEACCRESCAPSDAPFGKMSISSARTENKAGANNWKGGPSTWSTSTQKHDAQTQGKNHKVSTYAERKGINKKNTTTKTLSQDRTDPKPKGSRMNIVY